MENYVELSRDEMIGTQGGSWGYYMGKALGGFFSAVGDGISDGIDAVWGAHERMYHN